MKVKTGRRCYPHHFCAKPKFLRQELTKFGIKRILLGVSGWMVVTEAEETHSWFGGHADGCSIHNEEHTRSLVVAERTFPQSSSEWTKGNHPMNSATADVFTWSGSVPKCNFIFASASNETMWNELRNFIWVCAVQDPVHVNSSIGPTWTPRISSGTGTCTMSHSPESKQRIQPKEGCKSQTDETLQSHLPAEKNARFK